jgi:hypothetical protein
LVGIKDRQVAVGRLGPGASTVVRMRFNAESHWDVYLLDQAAKKHLGTCGYTGTIPGRPSENTVRLVSGAGAPSRDCVIALRT